MAKYSEERESFKGNKLLTAVSTGASGISCSLDGFAVIQGGGGMMADIDISAPLKWKGEATPFAHLLEGASFIDWLRGK